MLRAFVVTAVVTAAALACAFATPAAAHDIPNDVKVQMFVKPAGDRLQLLVRVPLAAMQEVDVPRRGPGYIDLKRADAALRNAATLWIADNMEIREGDERLGQPKLVDARITLPSDKSFGSFDEAIAHLKSPRLPENTDLYWNQQLLDVLFEYPIRSDRSEFSIDPKLARLGLQVTTVMRFLPPGGATRAFEYHGNPGLVRLDPRWHHAALRFVQSGFWHILDGIDHLLFILCLVIPFRKLGPLVLIITAFTVAHSITLVSAAFGLAPSGLWFPPLIETLIAVSILYMALENILGASVQRRWIIAFAFGLVHGFGFSFALRETLQFAGSHLLTSLLSFNIGVELGQLLVLIVLVPALDWLFRRIGERIGILILSALVGHTAWHWMVERWDTLKKFPLPDLDAASLAAAMRWLMAAMVLAGLVWLADSAIGRWNRDKAEGGRRKAEENRQVS